jgi:hypothetical protein
MLAAALLAATLLPALASRILLLLPGLLLAAALLLPGLLLAALVLLPALVLLISHLRLLLARRIPLGNNGRRPGEFRHQS